MVKKFRLDEETLKKYGVGYVLDKRFNSLYKKQGLNCPYQHCIETMPLHEKEKLEALQRGWLIDLRKEPGFEDMDSENIRQAQKRDPALYEKIRAFLDIQGIKDDECWFRPDFSRYIIEFGEASDSCRLYGHQCPGGKEQVDKCASEGMFDGFEC